MLRPFHTLLYVVICFCVLLGVVAQRLKAVKLLGQQLPTFFCSVIAEAWDQKTLDLFAQLFQHCWGRARALVTHGLQSLMGCILPTMRSRSQHCWELLHPFAHHCQHERNNSGVCTPLPTRTQQLSTLLEPTMLGVVASVCTPLPTRTQQLSTLLEPTMLRVVASVCTPLPTRTRQLSTLLEPTMLGVVASVCTPLSTRTQQLSTLLEPTMLGVVASVCTPLPTRTQQLLTLKVKNDHRSKFSNLSNWKEEA